MKNKMTLLSFLVLITCCVALTSSCTEQDKKVRIEKKSKTPNTKEYTSPFVCIRNCAGSGSHKPGKCPDCNLDYIENPNSKNSGTSSHHHSADDGHNHDGHNH